MVSTTVVNNNQVLITYSSNKKYIIIIRWRNGIIHQGSVGISVEMSKGYQSNTYQYCIYDFRTINTGQSELFDGHFIKEL